MRKLIPILSLLSFLGTAATQPVRTEVTNATTTAVDTKPNSDKVPEVYPIEGKFERVVVLRFKYQADLLNGLESMVKQ